MHRRRRSCQRNRGPKSPTALPNPIPRAMLWAHVFTTGKGRPRTPVTSSLTANLGFHNPSSSATSWSSSYCKCMRWCLYTCLVIFQIRSTIHPAFTLFLKLCKKQSFLHSFKSSCYCDGVTVATTVTPLPTSNSTDIRIVLKNVEVVTGIKTIAKACCLLLGLTYALNLSYPKAMRYSFEVFQISDSAKLSAKVQGLKTKPLSWNSHISELFWSSECFGSVLMSCV